MKKLPAKIALCIFLCLSLGIASGLSTAKAITNWYQYIQKPTWNPPNWLFGPVWTILYIMMGIAVALVWHTSAQNPYRTKAIIAFVVQFVLNLAWSHIFFNLHEIGYAFVEVLIMLSAIITTTVLFSKVSKTAAYLLVPYNCWVSFASILNGAVWLLNS